MVENFGRIGGGRVTPASWPGADIMTFESSNAPSSIEGITRLAQRIRRQSSIPHHEALSRAALAAGVENFAHARK